MNWQESSMILNYLMKLIYIKKIFKVFVHPIFLLVLLINAFLAYKFFGQGDLLPFDIFLKNYSIIFENLRTNIEYVIFFYLIIYILVTALSIPVASYMTILGGLLFGQIMGTVIVLIAATIGATIFFLIFRYSSNYLSKKINNSYLNRMRNGFEKNSFSYLLFLRLFPVFPFFMVNIVSAIMNVKLSHYFIATFIGMIPMTYFYCSLGASANFLINNNFTFSYSFLFSIHFLIPFSCIFMIMLISFIFKKKSG